MNMCMVMCETLVLRTAFFDLSILTSATFTLRSTFNV